MNETISKISFNRQNRITREALADPQRTHAIIAAATTGSQRPLYRVERDHILLLSDREPSLLTLGRELGAQNVVSRHIAWDSLFREGQQLQFLIEANPNGTDRLRGGNAVVEWLTHKLTPAASIDPSCIEWHYADCKFSHEQSNGREGICWVRRCRYQGIMTVDNPTALANLIRHGIGRSKAYGCGLLSVMPG